MNFEWDEQKRSANIHKHGIDFIDVPKLFDGLTLTMADTRFHYGEDRFITIGLLEGRPITVVHTEEPKKIRIISARKATRYEEKIYFSQISN